MVFEEEKSSMSFDHMVVNHYLLSTVEWTVHHTRLIRFEEIDGQITMCFVKLYEHEKKEITCNRHANNFTTV